MKQLLFIFSFFAFSIMVGTTQTDSVKKLHTPYGYNSTYMNPMPPDCRDVSKTSVIDSGFIRVLYALNATDLEKLETYDDLQRLEIGAQYSKYYSLFVFNTDSTTTYELMKLDPKALESLSSNLRVTMIIDGKFQGWSEYLFSEYFKDFLTGELTEYARMPYGLDKYNAQYSESIPVQNWVVSDETLTVAGYSCQKATCRFRGRDYTAWFTTDIPINNGPWKFGGLPGLILKAYDGDNLFTFECVGIENHKQKFPVEMNKVFEKYNKTDRLKLRKTKKEVQENFHQLLLSTTGRDIVVFSSEDPTYREEQAPYNPLELE